MGLFGFRKPSRCASWFSNCVKIAKSKHADYWNKIKAEPEFRQFAAMQFIRAAYFLELSEPYAKKLGSNRVGEIVAKMYAKENLGILEEFTGRKFNVTKKNCTEN